MPSICVFCGSSPGNNPVYLEVADRLAEGLAMRHQSLIYGGASVGLMGAVADGFLKRGGKVFGVIPKSLHTKEVAHANLTELEVVGSMHERKKRMSERADAFIALPGGWGTFEEFFEILTWAQLGLHQKPIGLLNVAGYYDSLLAQVELGIKEGFIRPEYRKLIIDDSDPARLIEKILSAHPPTPPRWLRDSSET